MKNDRFWQNPEAMRVLFYCSKIQNNVLRTKSVQKSGEILINFPKNQANS